VDTFTGRPVFVFQLNSNQTPY